MLQHMVKALRTTDICVRLGNRGVLDQFRGKIFFHCVYLYFVINDNLLRRICLINNDSSFSRDQACDVDEH